jgi:hypothetical protein
MPVSINSIIKVIAPLNNRYRDAMSSNREKLDSLWEIGDRLVAMGVTKPHSVGWAVQRETKGLIKRPTVFRSHKIRMIWPSKDELIKNLGDIHGLSNLTEILPLLDAAQTVRARLTAGHIKQIYQHACSDPPQKFKRYIANLKREFSHGRLGKALDKSKHLDELATMVSAFNILLAKCLAFIKEPHLLNRDRFRANNSAEELRAFSNMCIALTTKDNLRLYRRLGPPKSKSKNKNFQEVYNHFRQMLDKTNDVERARLRRLISAEALAQMSDVVSSLSSEEAARDFRDRQRIAISL